jgi:hypothetical protein
LAAEVSPETRGAADSGSLPANSELERVFGSGEGRSLSSDGAGQPVRVIVLPVVSNPSCEHHLAVYTAHVDRDRVRLAAFSKRESRDPNIPSRGWSVLCEAEMPPERVDEFLDLLHERLNGAPVELREVELGSTST